MQLSPLLHLFGAVSLRVCKAHGTCGHCCCQPVAVYFPTQSRLLGAGAQKANQSPLLALSWLVTAVCVVTELLLAQAPLCCCLAGMNVLDWHAG
jgi:hypothetical protein